MSFVEWLTSLKPLYKLLVACLMGLAVYSSFRILIYFANKESKKISENPKNKKLKEIDYLKEYAKGESY